MSGRENGKWDRILGAFAKLQNATTAFVTSLSLSLSLSVCLSVCPSTRNNSVPIGRIFVKFGISIFRKLVEKIEVL